jgi:hypothetical protein
VSELFGGLLKPGDAGMTALRLELERRRDSYGSEFPRPPYVFRGGADMCLRHGESFKGRVTPEKWRHLMGENGRCYINALTAAEAHPELRYFEGYYSWGKGHFTSHGWVVDDEGVVELSIETWLLENFHDKNGGRSCPRPCGATGASSSTPGSSAGTLTTRPHRASCRCSTARRTTTVTTGRGRAVST